MSMLEKARRHLKTSLTEEQLLRVRKFQATRFRRSQRLVYGTLFGSNLRVLATVYGTDKWCSHWYAQHYEAHFAAIRRRRLTLLEIGIGGYEDPRLGGGSLRMWRTYFPKASVNGIDIHDKSLHNERRIKTFKGSQTDVAFLEDVLRDIGPVDIIIDDGSHENEHVIFTFKHLFPRLSEKGMYVIEDTQTSYWPRYGGSSADLNSPGTTMGFLKALVDGLNHAEYEDPEHDPDFFERHITAMHFYHNIVFVQKGLNNEASNLVSKRPRCAGCPVDGELSGSGSSRRPSPRGDDDVARG